MEPQVPSTGTMFCATFNKRLYDEYAHQLIDTYVATKQVVPLYVFVEDNPKLYPPRRNVYYKNLFDYEPDLKDFVQRNKHRTANNFYEEAIRFSYKVFAKTHLMLEGNYDYVFWVDADVMFKKTITEEIILSQLNSNYMIRTLAFIGTIVMFISCDSSIVFEEYKNWYITDKVYSIQKLGKNFWTDCHTLDATRQMFKDDPRYSEKPLGDGRNGHIMARDTFLNPYIDHRKGKRKQQANSPEWRKHTNEPK